MKPTKSSPTSNQLGDLMNPSDYIKKLSNEDHSASFEQLPELINTTTTSTPVSNSWKPVYKIAASFILVCLTFVACSLPVQQEEEVGYMIKGVTTTQVSDFKTKLKASSGIELEQVSVSAIIHEEIGQDAQLLSEVIMVLPEADLELAEQRKQALSGIASFQSLEILPIEETVERPLYEAALKSVDLHVDKSLSNAQLAARINFFLQEHADSDIKANLDVDEEGKRVVRLYLTRLIKAADIEGNINIKRSIEGLARDVVPKDKSQHLNLSKEELLELKRKEILRLEQIKKAHEKDN